MVGTHRGRLAIGMAGYIEFEDMSLADSYVNAAIILSGMGPLGGPKTTFRPSSIRSFAVHTRRGVRKVLLFSKDVLDGLRVDIDGNLWCGWGGGEGHDGVMIFAPTGKLIGRIELPERCANVCSAVPSVIAFHDGVPLPLFALRRRRGHAGR